MGGSDRGIRAGNDPRREIIPHLGAHATTGDFKDARSIGFVVKGLLLFTPIQFGISKAIQAYTENLREHHASLTWHLDLANDRQLLSQQTCLTLFRIHQEAVNNIIRHSNAKEAWVKIGLLMDQIVLEIRDNGKGFTRSQDMGHLTERKHFGLAGIAERVETVNAEWEIITRPGDGTTIKVEVPIKLQHGG